MMSHVNNVSLYYDKSVTGKPLLMHTETAIHTKAHQINSLMRFWGRIIIIKNVLT